MPNVVDFVFLGFITVVATLVESYYFFPHFKAEVAAGIPNARRAGYRRTLIAQWVIALICLAFWANKGRSWTDLGLAPHLGPRLFIGLALAAVAIAFITHQTRAIRRASPQTLQALRPKFRDVEFILPHTRDEFRWFLALSLTAGFCEELLYRGYLFWVLGAFIGLPGAVVAGVVLFGVGHAYQGKRGIVKTALAGLVMSLIYVASGWLMPAMIVHALIDANSGDLALKVFGQPANSHVPQLVANPAE